MKLRLTDEWCLKYATLEAGHEITAGSLSHRCHSAEDGECQWKDCPQLRDNEPEKSGRHCPLDVFQELP